MLADSGRAFIERSCPPTRVRSIAAGESGFDSDLWDTMASLGWAGLVVGEEFGGSAQGASEMVVLCEAMGRGPVPSPLISSTLAALTITWAGDPGQRARWLPMLASGEAIGTLALVEPDGRDEWDDPRLAGGSSLRGTKLVVPWAGAAHMIVVSTAGGIAIVEVGRGGVVTERHDELGADPLFAVELRDAPAEPLGGGGMDHQRQVLARALDWATVMHLGYVVGAADRALEMAVDHAATRQQFGRPIGAFQAVAHRCVDMRTDLDACRFLAYQAASALDEGRSADLEVAAAKAYANEAIRRLFANAHQVHGALGFSTEHDLHLFSRRAKAFELSYGSTTRQLDRVAASMGLG